MDGWESRRRRTPGHDWCVVELGMRGRHARRQRRHELLHRQLPVALLDRRARRRRAVTRALAGTAKARPGSTLLPKSPLRATVTTTSRSRAADPAAARPWTHLRLNIFPDGGVARLRVYGDVVVDWTRIAGAQARDRSRRRSATAAWCSARATCTSARKDNMIMPGRATNMGDGWETRRRRGPGYDWAIVRLGAAGVSAASRSTPIISRATIPTARRSRAASRRARRWRPWRPRDWIELLAADEAAGRTTGTSSRASCSSIGPVSHVRLNIFPDGGISRLRVHGTWQRLDLAAPEPRRATLLRRMLRIDAAGSSG